MVTVLMTSDGDSLVTSDGDSSDCLWWWQFWLPLMAIVLLTCDGDTSDNLWWRQFWLPLMVTGFITSATYSSDFPWWWQFLLPLIRAVLIVTVLITANGDRSYCLCYFTTFIYSLTAGVEGAPQVTSRPVSSIFLCSLMPQRPQRLGDTWRWWRYSLILFIPYLRGSLGHHRWFRNQFPPFPPVLHCQLGFGELQACPFPNVVFPPLPLSALSSSPFILLCLAGLFWPDLTNGRHNHTTSFCVSLRWPRGLRVVRMPAGSWHRLPRW